MPQTPLEAALSTIIREFRKYGTYRNGTYVLTLDDFTRLMTQEMPDFLKSQGIELIQATPRDQMEKLFEELDLNLDGEVSIDEFIRIVNSLIY